MMRNSVAPMRPPAGIGSQMTAQNAAAAIHEMFVNTFGTGAGCYAATEAANAVAAT